MGWGLETQNETDKNTDQAQKGFETEKKDVSIHNAGINQLGEYTDEDSLDIEAIIDITSDESEKLISDSNGKPKRSPSNNEGTSVSTFSIQEYVSANGTQVNETITNSWGLLSQDQNLTHVTAYDLATPTNASGTALQFIADESALNVSDVVAAKDWVTVENSTDNLVTNLRNTTNWVKVGQKFSLTTRVRLYSIWVYVGSIYSGGDPDLKVSVCDDSGSNRPGSEITSETITDYSLSIRWYQITFSSPPILFNDTSYWITLEDVDAGQGDLKWGVNEPSVSQPDSSMCFYMFSTWLAPVNNTLPLMMQVLRLDSNNNTLTYTTPSSCDMSYGGIPLPGYSNIKMNSTDGTDDQVFRTNVSVVFNVTWKARYSAPGTHEISALSYFVSDGSAKANWNITFSCGGVKSSYSLSDYNLTLLEIPNDWAPGDIFTSADVNVTDDLSPVKDGRTWGVVNSSVVSGSANFTALAYRLEATSPNYVATVTVDNPAWNLTQSITVTSDFNNSVLANAVSRFNVSIIFPNGTEAVVNASMLQTEDPQNTTVPLLSSYPNGSYQFVTTYWNGTEVGLNISTVVTVYTPTDLTIKVIESSPHFIGDLFNITVFFNDTAKNQGIPGATTFTYDTDNNWGLSGSLLPEVGEPGNYSINELATDGKDLGDHWIQITIERPYYVSQILNLTVIFQETTSLVIKDNNQSVWYTDYFNLTLNYIGDTAGYLPSATILLNNSISMNSVGNGTYWYEINTTELIETFGKTGEFHYIINASAGSNYQEQVDLHNFTVLDNPSSIVATNASGFTLTNETTVTPLYFGNTYIIEFQYNDTQHNLTIDETPSIQFNDTRTLEYVTGIDGQNKTVTFTINDTGLFIVFIKFEPTYGYDEMTFTVTLDILAAQTTTNGQSGSQNVLFGTSYSFWINYTDVSNNEGIPGATPNIEGFASFDSASGPGNYTFTFDLSLTQMGTYSVNITFSKPSYSSQTVELVFAVIPRETIMIGTLDDGSPRSNESIIMLYYNNIFGFNLTWNDSLLSTGLSATEISATVNTSISSWLIQVGGNYDYQFSALGLDRLGLWNITIHLGKYGYVNQSWVLYAQVDSRPTLLTTALTNGTVLLNNSNLHFLIEENVTFSLNWLDTNSSSLVPSPGAVPVSNPIGAIIQLSGLNFTVDSDPSDSLPKNITVTITLTRNGYVKQVYYAFFIIHGRATNFPVLLSSSSSTVLADYNFSVLYWWSETIDSNISDATVNVFVNGSATTDFSVETDAINGLYNITLNTTSLDKGFYNISYNFVKYGYESQVNHTQLTLLPHMVNMTIISFSESVDAGQNVTVVIQLNDLDSNAAPEGVIFSSDWNNPLFMDIGNSDIDTGTYHVLLFTNQTTPDSYTSIQISYTGFQLQSNSTSISFEVIGSFFTPDLEDVGQFVNETAVYTLTIVDQFNNPVSDLIVSWLLNNTDKTGNATSLGSGTYRITVDCTLLTANEIYILQLSTNRTYYHPFSVNTTLTVFPKYVTILQWHDLPTVFTQGENLVLEVQLTFENGTPIQNEPINFTIVLRYEGTPPSLSAQFILISALEMLSADNTLILNISERTGTDGIATVKIDKRYTKTAVALEDVLVSYTGAVGYAASSLPLPVSSIAIKPPSAGIDPIWIGVAAFAVAIFALFSFQIIRRREKTKAKKARRRSDSIQEFLEILGIRHVLISHNNGIPIYSETHVEQIGAADSDALSGLIAALGSFLQEFTKEETEFSRFAQSGFNMTSRGGKHTRITLITENETSKITEQALRDFQNALEEQYEEILKMFISTTQIPQDNVRAMCWYFLHTDLLYALSIDETTVTKQWKRLTKIERRTVHAARRIVNRRKVEVFYLNTWISELRNIGFNEPDMLQGIFAVTSKKLVYVKDLESSEINKYSA